MTVAGFFVYLIKMRNKSCESVISCVYLNRDTNNNETQKTMKVYPEQNKNYFHASEALADLGFEQVVAFKPFNKNKGVQERIDHVFTKDGNIYQFNGMLNNGTIIERITLKKLNPQKVELA